MIVVIDDERTFTDPHFDFAVYLRTSQEALSWFAKYITDTQNDPEGGFPGIQEIWFDHDLGEKSEDDAIVVATFLAVMFWKLADDPIFQDIRIFVHSQNYVGAQNIINSFRYSTNEAKRAILPKCL